VIDGVAHIYAEANYVVIRTKYDGDSTVYNCGIYRDDIVKTGDGFKFALRHAIYDSEMVPNSVIYPI
jgi:salicylate 5-hydroxylase small subunit